MGKLTPQQNEIKRKYPHFIIPSKTPQPPPKHKHHRVFTVVPCHSVRDSVGIQYILLFSLYSLVFPRFLRFCMGKLLAGESVANDETGEYQEADDGVECDDV